MTLRTSYLAGSQWAPPFLKIIDQYGVTDTQLTLNASCPPPPLWPRWWGVCTMWGVYSFFTLWTTHVLIGKGWSVRLVLETNSDKLVSRYLRYSESSFALSKSLHPSLFHTWNPGFQPVLPWHLAVIIWWIKIENSHSLIPVVLSVSRYILPFFTWVFQFIFLFFPIFVIGTFTSQKKLLPISVKWYPDFNLILRTMCESLPNYYICKVIIFKNWRKQKFFWWNYEINPRR